MFLRLDNFLPKDSGSGEQQQDGRSDSERWPPVPPCRLGGRNAFLNSLAQRGIGRVTLARRMNHAFPLQPTQSICRASGTLPQVAVQFLHLSGIEFTVEVGVQLSGPQFVGLFGHGELLCNFCCTASRRARRARDNRDITVPTGIASAAAISWYDISSTSQSSSTSR